MNSGPDSSKALPLTAVLLTFQCLPSQGAMLSRLHAIQQHVCIARASLAKASLGASRGVEQRRRLLTLEPSLTPAAGSQELWVQNPTCSFGKMQEVLEEAEQGPFEEESREAGTPPCGSLLGVGRAGVQWQGKDKWWPSVVANIQACSPAPARPSPAWPAILPTG